MKDLNKKWVMMSLVAVVVVLIIAVISSLIVKGDKTEKISQPMVDSVSLTVATLPTIDCLPVYVAIEDSMFEKAGLKLRPVPLTAHMDCDTALTNGSVLIAFSDVIRAQRLIRKRVPLTFLSQTMLSWKLVTNHKSRITTPKSLKEKFVAITRFSATDYLSEKFVDSIKLKREDVYRPQINDIKVRIRMLANNGLDGALLPEPYATEAIGMNHSLLIDFSSFAPSLGVIAMRQDLIEKQKRQKQLELFKKVYDEAVDSINAKGVRHYGNVIRHYCKVRQSTVDSLKVLKFMHITPVPPSAVTLAHEWLDKH